MRLGTKDILTLAELTPEEFTSLIQNAITLKSELKAGKQSDVLKGKTMVMIFQKPSTRTRVSFETGMYQMGGHAINLSANDMQLSRGESIEDTARTLDRYADCIMARVYEHKTVEMLAEHSTIPVINGLSNTFHPCQTLADFMTIAEKQSTAGRLKIAWIGDGNNVCNSTIIGASLAGHAIAVATPKGFEPDDTTVSRAQRNIDVTLTTDPMVAATDADVIMTDTYSSIHNNKGTKRTEFFLPRYQVGQEIMDAADTDAIFMHCLPAKRGEEVTAQVIDGPSSVVWDEAENRLHAQKALLEALIAR